MAVNISVYVCVQVLPIIHFTTVMPLSNSIFFSVWSESESAFVCYTEQKQSQVTLWKEGCVVTEGVIEFTPWTLLLCEDPFKHETFYLRQCHYNKMKIAETT